MPQIIIIINLGLATCQYAQLTLEPCPGCHLHDVNITKPSRTTCLDPLFCDLEIDLLQAWNIPSGPLTRKKKNDPSSRTTVFLYSFREYMADYNRTNLHLQRFPPIDHYADYKNILTPISNNINNILQVDSPAYRIVSKFKSFLQDVIYGFSQDRSIKVFIDGAFQPELPLGCGVVWVDDNDSIMAQHSFSCNISANSSRKGVQTNLFSLGTPRIIVFEISIPRPPCY